DQVITKMERGSKLLHAIVMEGHSVDADEPSAITVISDTVNGWLGWGGPVAPVESTPNGAVSEFKRLHRNFLESSKSYQFAGKAQQLRWIARSCAISNCRHLAETFASFLELATAKGLLPLSERIGSVLAGVLAADLGATKGFQSEVAGFTSWIESQPTLYAGVSGSTETRQALARSLLREPSVYVRYRIGQFEMLRAKLGGVFLRMELPAGLQAVTGKEFKPALHQLILALVDGVSSQFFAENKLRPVLDRLLAPGGYQGTPGNEILISLDLRSYLKSSLARANDTLSPIQWLKLEAGRTEEAWWTVSLRKADLFPLVAQIQATQKAGSPELPSVDALAQDLAVAALLRPLLRSALTANDKARQCLADLSCTSDRALLKSNGVAALNEAAGPFVESGVQAFLDETFAWENRLDRWSHRAHTFGKAGMGAVLASLFLPTPPLVGGAIFGGILLSSVATTSIAALQAADLWVTARATSSFHGTGILGEGALDPAIAEGYNDRFNRQMSQVAIRIPIEIVFQGMMLSEGLPIAKEATSAWIRSWGLGRFLPTQAEKEAMIRLGIHPEMTPEQAGKISKTIRAASHPDKLGPGADQLAVDLAAARFSQLNDDWRVARSYFDRITEIDAAGGLRAKIFKVLRAAMGSRFTEATVADDLAEAGSGQLTRGLLEGPVAKPTQAKMITMQPSDEDFALIGLNRSMSAREAEARFRQFTLESNPVVLELAGKMTTEQAAVQYAKIWVPAYEAWTVRLEPYFRGNVSRP
ncbi:MAG: hypothetical protein AAB425_01840, partial [Bdellovibrionota bacterium]